MSRPDRLRMTPPHLFGARQSGHSYKVRLFLLFAEVEHDYTSIDIGQPRDQRPEPFRSLAPHGEVPLLVDDGLVLSQSNAILLHLARKLERFGGASETEWSEITSWLFWEANRIGRSYPNLRWYRLFDASGAPDLVAWFKSTAEADLDRLERQLTGRAFIVLNRPTIVDLSCAGYLLYGDNVGLEMARWPRVDAWLERIRALPGYRAPLDVMG